MEFGVGVGCVWNFWFVWCVCGSWLRRGGGEECVCLIVMVSVCVGVVEFGVVRVGRRRV